MLLDEATDIDLQIEEVTTADALEQLRPAWSALWARCPDATPFQAPEWLIPWWRHFGVGDLWVLALRQGEALVGLVPLYLYATEDRPTRTVMLLGTGNTDYLDALLAPLHAPELLAAVFDHLHQHRHRWDVCDLQQLRPGSALLAATPPRAWRDEVDDQAICPALVLPPADAAAGIPSGFLKKLRYYRRRSKRTGTVRVEAAEEDNFEELFDALLCLHGARWAEQDESGVLAGRDVRRFHETVARGMLRRGLLRLYGYRLDGRLVASYYGFTHRRRAYYYLSGFDPSFDKLSLGNQIVHYAVEAAVEEGVETFDFLRGQEAYKYRWGAEDHTNHRRRLHHTPAENGR